MNRNKYNGKGLAAEYEDLHEHEEINIIGNNISDDEDYSLEEEEKYKEYDEVKKVKPIAKLSTHTIKYFESGFEVTIPIVKVWNKRINVNLENASVMINIFPKTFAEGETRFSKRFPLLRTMTKKNTKVQTQFLKGALVVMVSPK